MLKPTLSKMDIKQTLLDTSTKQENLCETITYNG